MNDKSAYKIGLFPLILLILDIVLIIVIIIMGIVIYSQRKIIEKNNIQIEIDKSVNNSNLNETVEENIISQTENILNTNSTTNTIIENKVNNSIKNNTSTDNNTDETKQYAKKVVENRSYVYDAQYMPNGVKVNNYSLNDGTNYSISDIKVPYINIESSDINLINSEIQELYDKWIDEFKICSQNLNSFIKVNYNTFITSNIYSVLITIDRGKEENNTEEHIAYNFDIISGTKLDYNQVCYISGINNADESVKKVIDNLEDFNDYYLTDIRRYSEEEIEKRKLEIEENKNQILNYYKEDVSNNRLVYFLDNNLKVNISIKIILPNNEGEYNKIVNL